jgi:hypothetical protein
MFAVDCWSLPIWPLADQGAGSAGSSPGGGAGATSSATLPAQVPSSPCCSDAPMLPVGHVQQDRVIIAAGVGA